MVDTEQMAGYDRGGRTCFLQKRGASQSKADDSHRPSSSTVTHTCRVEVYATIQVGIRPHHSRASVEAVKAARAAISIAHIHQVSMDIILHQLSIPGHGIGTEGGSVFSEDHD